MIVRRATPALRVIPAGEISSIKMSGQASEKLLLTKLPPGGPHDGPVVCHSTLVDNEVDRKIVGDSEQNIVSWHFSPRWCPPHPMFRTDMDYPTCRPI